MTTEFEWNFNLNKTFPTKRIFTDINLWCLYLQTLSQGSECCSSVQRSQFFGGRIFWILFFDEFSIFSLSLQAPSSILAVVKTTHRMWEHRPLWLNVSAKHSESQRVCFASEEEEKRRNRGKLFLVPLRFQRRLLGKAGVDSSTQSRVESVTVGALNSYIVQIKNESETFFIPLIRIFHWHSFLIPLFADNCLNF